MSLPAKLKRYSLILEKIQRQPTFADLHEHLAEHGFELSHRTLQRDIERVRIDLGIEVEYDRSNNVYRITGDRKEHDTVVQLMERAQLFQLVGDDPKRLHELAQHIDIEGLGSLQGLQHISSLLRAIREHVEVTVVYQRFQAERSSSHRLRPLLLKEYQGRWYVMGMSKKYPRPLTLGLDRILSVELTTVKFKATGPNKAREILATMIGVDASPEKAERIVLEVSEDQAKYIASLPWHSSQRMEIAGNGMVVISWFVRPNYELRQRILGLGCSARVLEPKWLTREIHRELKAAIANYEG